MNVRPYPRPARRKNRQAVGVAITLVRGDGQAGRNEAVVWTVAEAEALLRSTWAQFRAQCDAYEAQEVQA